MTNVSQGKEAESENVFYKVLKNIILLFEAIHI